MAWGQKHVRLSDREGLRQNMASLSDKAGRERGMKGDTISRSALIAEIKKWTTDCACIELIENEPAVDAAPEAHRALTDIYVRDKSDGSIHRVGDDYHDSLAVENGVVSYYNLQNGEGTGEHGDYEFVDSMWGEMDGGGGE